MKHVATDLKFDVILADPPWRFKVWDRKTGLGKSADRHYPTMTHEEIAALPVADILAPNAALFLWVVDWLPYDVITNVIESWGFTRRTRAWVWVKKTKSGDGWHMGTGYYTRANPEDCLLGVRGSMPVADRGVLRLMDDPVGPHSQKPDSQYEKIERLYPTARKLELFARKNRPGWFAWGNEIKKDVILCPEKKR